MGIMHPTEVMKNIVPVIMAGILGIYGLIVAAIVSAGGVARFAAPPAFVRGW
jgi:ATP synthase proteolipid subunit